MLEGNGWLVEVCGPRAAAAHGHACLLMMDCDGRVCVAASDPMTVLQSWVRGWYLCLGAAAHRSTSIAASIGHRRQRQRLRQRQHQQRRGSACCFVACGRLAANAGCVCRYCTCHMFEYMACRRVGPAEPSIECTVMYCTVSFTRYERGACGAPPAWGELIRVG